ncbi:sugar ABC transporter ATP-binding protein [Actinacidiphila acididurans]|uniref:Sugar ABC transporter ATP-binding protein n=1 Tax=Actinacidiphila acididurans TaxID=2784346 RepID=A0ABS2TSN3_9ACTN|nr:sugar ABC transporter ATP-binding protein [Actinacidiphila acididurans]MBM9506354.1 sugar ABC transporter ATP-binding protein [Actinacidiphila acididurans]
MTYLADRLVKTFPGVRALDGATLRLQPGSVHALLGENGAGKSTLIKIMTGVLRPDGGRILVPRDDAGAHGKEPGPATDLVKGPSDTDAGLHEVRFSGPQDAQRAGIGVVHQERNLIPAFSVAENIALQSTPRRRGLVDRAAMRELARGCLDRLGVRLDVDRPVSALSVAQMQLVEIAKALATDSRVLLLDEPTASLTAEETEHLFGVVRRLRDEGRAVVLVSHKLEEVFAVADTVTVLRDGRSVAEAHPLADYTQEEIVNLMVGRAHAARRLDKAPVAPGTAPALRLDGVATALGHRDVSLSVRPGEILGLYGLVGAGRSELARAVLGLHPVTAGTVQVHGRPTRITSVGQALHRHRIGYVSENRKEEGVFLQQPLTRNVAVTVWNRLSRAGLIRDRDERDLLTTYQERLGIRLSGPAQLAGQLSGGNQQKISLAKWLAADCDILIIDEPTVGIDVRTKAAFHELIVHLASDGLAILLISSDLPEMVTLADRVLVMRDYRLTGEVANDTHDYDSTSRAIGHLLHAAAV